MPLNALYLQNEVPSYCLAWLSEALPASFANLPSAGPTVERPTSKSHLEHNLTILKCTTITCFERNVTGLICWYYHCFVCFNIFSPFLEERGLFWVRVRWMRRRCLLDHRSLLRLKLYTFFRFCWLQRLHPTPSFFHRLLIFLLLLLFHILLCFMMGRRRPPWTQGHPQTETLTEGFRGRQSLAFCIITVRALEIIVILHCTIHWYNNGYILFLTITRTHEI